MITSFILQIIGFIVIIVISIPVFCFLAIIAEIIRESPGKRNCFRCGRPCGAKYFTETSSYCPACRKKDNRELEKKIRELMKEFSKYRCQLCDGNGKIKGYRCEGCKGKGFRRLTRENAKSLANCSDWKKAELIQMFSKRL